jgi:hypothetical protein
MYKRMLIMLLLLGLSLLGGILLSSITGLPGFIIGTLSTYILISLILIFSGKVDFSK